MKDQQSVCNVLPDAKQEKIKLEGTVNRKKRGFAAFLICCALLIAAFAVTELWKRSGGKDWFGSHEAPPKNDTSETPSQDGNDNIPQESFPSADPVPLPDGAIPIVSMDLSYASYGKYYLINETNYVPDWDALLMQEVGCETVGDAPLVLILHTHTSESYLPCGTQYVEGKLGDLTYSSDASSNMLSVGEVFCRTLNEKGIKAIHCPIVHDAPGLSGSYERSAETVRRYLEQYPSIRYVIDLHRDSVTSADGSIVRSEGSCNGSSVAQVMAVVGTDENGTTFENGWEGNLALALQLGEKLNENGNSVARPIYLRRSPFNQELAEYTLLLEIGTAANSPGEAKHAAELVGYALAELIYAR